MLAIKFKRIGKKHQPSFRVVVMEKRSKMQGRFVDDLGWYNLSKKTFDLDKEKAKHWLSVGAQPTDSVHNLLVKSGTVTAKKRPTHKKKKVATETPATAEKSVK